MCGISESVFKCFLLTDYLLYWNWKMILFLIINFFLSPTIERFFFCWSSRSSAHIIYYIPINNFLNNYFNSTRDVSPQNRSKHLSHVVTVYFPLIYIHIKLCNWKTLDFLLESSVSSLLFPQYSAVGEFIRSTNINSLLCNTF